jgi:hypothetical protein
MQIRPSSNLKGKSTRSARAIRRTVERKDLFDFILQPELCQRDFVGFGEPVECLIDANSLSNQRLNGRLRFLSEYRPFQTHCFFACRN